MKTIYSVLTIVFWITLLPAGWSENTSAPPSVLPGDHNIIKGQVSDARTQSPLMGAVIMVEGARYGTETNEIGQFNLRTDTLISFISVTMLGYETQKIEIADPEVFLEIALQPTSFNLDQIVISAPSVNPLNTISRVDADMRPIQSAQDVLRVVPGLFIAQHAGGGKAEQIFLRGFDIDHGTDVNLTVDGMPVNMVSHAHGQGYADLHFVIPELIKQVDFGKGPYYANKGDFTTAGYIDMQTFRRLERSQLRLEAGQFNTLRTLLMADLLGKAGRARNQGAYIAADYRQTDGPFDSPQNFNRINLFGKYNRTLDDGGELTLSASHFFSKWDASGQIPQRAVDEGLITRFGAIDDTEGGNTSRTNIQVEHLQPAGNGFFNSKLYFSHYTFELYSNFTFFLNDPVNGDQIRQKEVRNLFGYQGSYDFTNDFNAFRLRSRIGLELRNDQVNDNELSHTRNRQETLERRAFGDVNQTNAAVFVDEQFEFGAFLLNAGLRLDYFKWNYQDKLDSLYRTQADDQLALQPKLNLIYNANEHIQYYLKGGIGFHSNDARVVVAEPDRKTLPLAYGADLGFIWKPAPRLMINTALWYLYLQQEFVYVGDEAVVEPGDPTRRMGLDLSLRYQPLNWLWLDFDVNYADPRILDVDAEVNNIPLAPRWTSVGGLSFRFDSGINGSLRYRYIQDRPANEDNSVVALGYTVFDLNLNYTKQRFEISIGIENLFDAEWNEAQFDTESRLRNEPAPISELHFTPGTPFFAKIGGSLFF